jgi:predicted esterase
MTDTRIIEARTHGSYLVRRPDRLEPRPALVGFHGYRENAGLHLDAMARIPGAEHWLLVAVQGLHLSYTREQDVVASWMTRQNRNEAIADNIEYVGRVLDAVAREYGARSALVFAGFSQGGAMAYRAAAHYPADAVIVLAADVPPDVASGTPLPLPPVLIGRGTRDKWYTEARHAADLAALGRLGTAVDSCVFEGGHEWADPFYLEAARILRRVERART